MEKEAPYPEYFKAVDKGETWHLFCKICGAGFSLKKTSTHPGNLLALLNHYTGCKEKQNGR